MINTVPPGEPALPPDLDMAAAMEELERQMPGAMAANEPGTPGMHTTDSLDYVLVVSGEATLELDDGERTVLRAGDVVIQNGTRHAWHNYGTEPCTIVGVAIGADRIVPVGNAEILAEGIPGARLRVLEAAGHLYPTEQPDIDEEIARFFLEAR